MNKKFKSVARIIGRIMLAVLCIVPPLALFILPYLIITIKPKQTYIISGNITRKRSQMVHSRGFGIVYYLTVDSKELIVSQKIYDRFFIGDYISATYRKRGIFDSYMLIKLFE